jgi:hypothetical protein
MAIRIAHRLRAETGAEITLRTILEHPTVALLAAELDRLVIVSATGSAPSPTSIPRVARVARPSRP